jgi:hypothetical protein
LALVSGYGCYITVKPERKILPGLKSGFGLKYPLGLLESSRNNGFSRDDKRGYRNMYEISQGVHLNQGG